MVAGVLSISIWQKKVNGLSPDGFFLCIEAWREKLKIVRLICAGNLGVLERG